MATHRILNHLDRAVGWAVDRMVDRLYGPIVPFLDVPADQPPRPAGTAPVDPAVSLSAGSGGIHLDDWPPGRGHLPNDDYEAWAARCDESRREFIETHPSWKEVLS